MNAGIERIPEDQVNLIVEVFRMLADATRIQVLWALSEGESSVNELAEMVRKPAPSVSHPAVRRDATARQSRKAAER